MTSCGSSVPTALSVASGGIGGGRVLGKTPAATPPRRIQRKRTKGWRMPAGAVYVGRPSRWGNPFTVMNGHRQGWLVWDDRDRLGYVTYTTSDGFIAAFPTHAEAAAFAVKQYRKFMFRQWNLTDLRGRDLACWCPLDRACHVDVLLDLANRGAA